MLYHYLYSFRFVKYGKLPGARFSKVPKTFRARKAILKTPTAYSVKLVFSYVLKCYYDQIQKFFFVRPINTYLPEI